MRGTIQNKVDRETRFTNEFDKFVAEPEEALVSVYNRFAQLMNDLERNDMHFSIVTINTKFLNSLQPECNSRNKVNVLRAKKLEKSHDPLALVAHTGSSSRNTSSYYVTHPTSVVDYEDEYQQDDVHTNSEDPLASAMLLLARAITHNFSNPTNNYLRTSSNTRNQAIIQGDRVNIQSRNSGNTLTVQCYNYSGKRHYARNCPKPRVWDSKYFMEQMLLAKQDEAGVILTDEHAQSPSLAKPDPSRKAHMPLMAQGYKGPSPHMERVLVTIFYTYQLLEVSLKHEVELSVLLNHECVDNSLHAEIEQLKKKSIKIQEGLQARIKILEKDVQECVKSKVSI
ncbi:retrovirus-related pol polyprotein from transposon TNT 1-94 [Tanacetum coccineum]|uniref:Retrovirus-related pol polyprotein from transposon TNT 1-94 n=1 Tax=Tanacetum coccineum TaxID=301880 RepID=A0ABQ5IGK2_9ASTR